MTPTSLQGLPNEILYRIIVLVDFSHRNFQALTLTCHCIYDLMRANSRGGRLLTDIATAQYPLAVKTLQYLDIPFFEQTSISSYSSLDELKSVTKEVEFYVKVMGDIRQQMLENQPQLTASLATTGWDYNLRKALHLAFLPSPFRIPTRHAHTRERDFIFAFQYFPARYVLAYHHAMSMMAEVATCIKAACKYPRDVLVPQNVAYNHPNEGGTQRAQVKDPVSYLFTFQPDFFMRRLNGLKCLMGYFDGELVTVSTLTRLTYLPSDSLIRGSVNKKLRNILDDWDRHIAEDPTMVENLQPISGSAKDSKAIRELVESFLVSDNETG